MYNKFDIQALLVLFVSNLKTPIDSACLMEVIEGKYYLPTSSIQLNTEGLDSANKLLVSVTSLDPTWVRLKQVGFFDRIDRVPDKRVIGVSYYGYIYAEVPLNSDRYKWVKLLDLFKDTKIIAYDYLEIIEKTIKGI